MPFRKTVLALVRTFNTTVRLLDVLPELLEDHRVQVLFALSDERSSFDDGALELVREAGGRIVPWEQALATEFDLVIGASFTGGYRQLRGPQLIISHGAGIGKKTAVPHQGKVETSAVCHPGRGRGHGEAPGTVYVLTHQFERELFAADQAAGVSFLIAGDPCFDRLEASLGGADRYREAMGVGDRRRLVVVNSTWGPDSLLFQNPELPARLVAELPVDEFQVALILHPNIWFGHGSWQVRTWLKRALEAGLTLVSPRDAWRGALVAADLVVGDHGTVTVYGAGLGKALLLGSTGGEGVIAGTPTDHLMRQAPKLAAAEPLLPQVEAALASHERGRYDDVIVSMFGYRGEALALLHEEIYRILGLEPPSTKPRVLAVDPPAVDRAPVTAHRIFARHEGEETILWRHPAALEARTPPPRRFHHLAVEEDEPDGRLLESAAIVVGRRTGASGARGWGEATLRTYPGARFAAAVGEDASVQVFSRHRNPVLLTADPEEGRRPPDPALLASAFYVWEVAGEVQAEEVRAGKVRVGEESFRLLAAPLASAL